VTWQEFVIAYGRRVRHEVLAHILEQPVEAIRRVRQGGTCTPGKTRTFTELFTLWRGRAPEETDWPRPRKLHGTYEWQAPELALLARLVGIQSPDEIARTLTERVRVITGDPTAERDRERVVAQIHRVGLQANDVVGGLTTAEAAKRAGCTIHLIHQEISRGKLRCFRVGTRKVIPVRALEEWKAARLPDPPAGWIKLYDIRRELGFAAGDGLSWKAKRGLIPEALFCAGHRWWVPPHVAADLLERRRKGLPMPWSGFVEKGDARRSFELWRRRRHRACDECRAIWRTVGGEPRTFDEWYPRWLTIPEATKRHLTSPDGISVTIAAQRYGTDKHTITSAIRAGILRARREGPRWCLRPKDVETWLKRRRPLTSQAGVPKLHHEPLTFTHAASQYGVSEWVLRGAVVEGLLHVVPRYDGQPGLLRHELAALHARLGDISVKAAAKKLGISVATFLREAKACGWREDRGVTSELVYAIRKRRETPWLLTHAAAAARLGVDVAWIRRAIAAGVLKPLRDVNGRPTMVGRKLVDALRRNGLPELPDDWTNDGTWLRPYEATAHAGVTTSTMKRWIALGRIEVLDRGPRQVFYSKSSIEHAARRYWAAPRSHRITPPAWLQAERSPSTTEAA
jgi:hypothetical protein